eukprot:PITA_09416
MLLEKLESRLTLWTHRSLSIASRLVLIKSMLQAMPLYLFSILAAPKWVLKRIKDLQHNFLWGANDTNRKCALVKWTTACKPKEKRGHWSARPLSYFWEIRNGSTARFWTDAWNQLPKLNSILSSPSFQDWEEKQKESVEQQSTPEIEQGYRKWKQTDRLIRNADYQNKETLERELEKRRIRYSEGKDILRWGYTPRGSFTTKEAYKLKCQDSTP